MSGLPGILQEIADVVGHEAAIKVADVKGGGRVYLPAKLKDTHWLVLLLGMKKARELAHYFNSGLRTIEIDIPLGPSGIRGKTWRKLETLISEGKSSDEIARTLGISRRTVLRRRVKLKADRQTG